MITSYFDCSTGKDVVRAHHWGTTGYSTKTCATAGEAQSFINKCKATRP